MGYIQKQGAGGIGHVRGALAGEAEANVVLGKQNVPHALPIRGFVFADPENLCKGKVRKCGIASELNQALQAESASELAALLFGADVAPNQRGAHDTPLFVEKNSTMHLAGETDAGDVLPSKIRASQRFADCDAGGVP